MAKRKESAAEPVISSIPVPPSDSALVIDLPDGQKLLVGKIETGTVIEVATWRGTGRPDSRTNRLMLGMSSESEAKKPESAEAESSQSLKDLKFPSNVIPIALKIAKQAAELIKNLLLRLMSIVKNLDVKNLRNAKLKLPKFKLGKKKGRIEAPKNSSGNLKMDEDFELDFQRILDEVSQRRSNKSASLKQRKADGPSNLGNKVEKTKSGGKKSAKRRK